MDTSLVASETVDLLSRITGQKLTQRDLTPPVIFLANLVTVLLGVMFADGTVLEEEKQRWQKIINKFIPSEGNVRQLTQLMSKGVRQNQIYKSKEFLTLTTPLSESEKLLLIGFGYQMAAADGEIATSEKKYLEIVAKLLRIKPEYLVVLEAGFTNQGILDPATLDEVIFLLDPSRFHELDTLFVAAAADILATLPTKPERKTAHKQRVSSYGQLKDFQKYHKQLDNFCYQLFEIIQGCNNRELLPETMAKEITEVSQKIQSQRFRLAVVGEFSQGKSTLLNALLGEEIQPVRAIPCSGTVTVLRYGKQKRVVCHYKDRNRLDLEIPFDQYKEKASIPEQAAISGITDELANSEIDEIIFEHPDLELCSSGVEIIDTPGFNEHDDRTAITQKVLQDTDAAIFLTSASRSLTKGELTLLQDLRKGLNGGKENEPADNLFVLVNFMDMLRREKDRQDVRQRIENFVQGQTPIVVGENRIHFISAQAALDAILDGTQDEYLNSFQNFTYSIETFLTIERGSLKIKQSINKIQGLIRASLDGLHQADDALDGKIKLSEADKQKIVEQIGEASGRDGKISFIAYKLTEQAIELAAESWQEWAETLDYRIREKSESWSSEHSNKEKLFRDYGKQFTRDLSADFTDWVDKKVGDSIVKPRLKILNKEIKQEIKVIQQSLKSLDAQNGSNLSNQFELSLADTKLNINMPSSTGTDGNDEGGAGWFAGLGGGGLVAGALLAFTGLGLIPVALIGGAAALGLGWLFGEDQDEVRAQIKQAVCEQGFTNFFNESAEKSFEEVSERIRSAFEEKVETASEVIEQAISLYENLLEQQEKAHKETVEQREAEKAFIAQKRQELEQVQKEIAALLTQATA